MEDLKNKTSVLTDHLSDYIETYYKLVVLNATEKATGVASVSITSLILSVLAIFTLFFASLGVGWWAGETLGNMLAGFSIIAGFYLVVIMLIFAFKKQIIPSIQNILIRTVYEENNNVASGSDSAETRITKAA